jgi:hypothetical protein
MDFPVICFFRYQNYGIASIEDSHCEYIYHSNLKSTVSLVPIVQCRLFMLLSDLNESSIPIEFNLFISPNSDQNEYYHSDSVRRDASIELIFMKTNFFHIFS